MKVYFPIILLSFLACVTIIALKLIEFFVAYDSHFLLISTAVFTVTTVVFATVLKRLPKESKKNISSLIGIIGISMFVFLFLLLFYAKVGDRDLVMKPALSLLVLYFCFKFALFYPILRT